MKTWGRWKRFISLFSINENGNLCAAAIIEAFIGGTKNYLKKMSVILQLERSNFHPPLYLKV